MIISLSLKTVPLCDAIFQKTNVQNRHKGNEDTAKA